MFKPVVECDEYGSCWIKIEFVLRVSFPLKVLFFQSMLSTTWVTTTPCFIFAGTILDVLSFHSPQLFSINFVPVYNIPCPILCKSWTITLGPVFLYTFNDKSSCDNDGQLLGIRDSMSSQILETFVAFGFDTFTIPFSS